MTRPVIGVDPGGKSTGVIARDGNRLLYAATLTRDGDMTAYLVEVVNTVIKAFAAVHRHQLANANPITKPLLGVEDLNEPTPQMGLTNVAGLIGAAQVLGAVRHAYPAAIIVPPGGHGSAPLRSYPDALIGPREVIGTGARRHVRSAFDIAGAAVPMSLVR